MSGPGLAFAERVRVVTIAEEIASLGFSVVGRRALEADRPADRLDVSEASRYLGAVSASLADLAPDAVGLRAVADDVRNALRGSAGFAALTGLLDGGSLRQVTVALVTALRSTLLDVAPALSPTADRSFAVSLTGIDGSLGAALRSLAAPASAPTAEAGDPDNRSVNPGSVPPGSATSDGASLEGVRVATLVLGLLGSGRKSFSSPLSVPKSPVSNH